MRQCECCGQSKPNVLPRRYVRDLSGYRLGVGQRTKFTMYARMCSECFQESDGFGTKAYEWLREKRYPPPDRL
jgi:hypothetical protein